MNKRLILGIALFLLIVIISTACGPSTPTGGTPAPDNNITPEGSVLEDVTAVPPATTGGNPPQGYPPVEQIIPEPPTRDPGYPAPPTPEPTVDPYPGGLVWIIRPVGIQCETGTAEGYADLREAVATLTAAGVTVSQSEMTELMVTTVCGAPTSDHYLVQIDADGLNIALSLGWSQQ